MAEKYVGETTKTMEPDSIFFIMRKERIARCEKQIEYICLNKMEEKYDRFLDAGEEPRQILQPIEGYQKKPLVSLEEAVEPIISFCPDIRRRVFIAMSNCTRPEDGLTQNESASIYLYTMEWAPQTECLYYVLNRILRSKNRNELKPWFSYLKLILTALGRLPPETKVIWRGVKLDLSQEYQVGERYVWWAFSSCTLSIAVLESDDFLGKYGPRTLFNIECLNGRMIRSHSLRAIEDEILLLPATQFEVKSKLAVSSNLHIIHLKQVNPPFILIESPSPPLSIKSTIDLRKKQQVSRATPSTISNTRPKVVLKEKPETLSKLTTPIASFHSKSNQTKKIQQTLNNYRNEQLEKLISQCSVNGPVKLESQELTDNDIPIIIQRAIIDLKCSDLNISWNNITDVGAKHLGDVLQPNTSLQRLDISGNRISNIGIRSIIETLYNNTFLTILDLGRNQINNEGAQFIAQLLLVNSTLKEIFLYTNSIGDSGTRHIAQALTSNTTLTILNLGRNEITDQGINHLAKMLKRNTALTHFYMGENRVTNNGMKIIMNALSNNQELRWLGVECIEITNKSIECIQEMFKLNKTLGGLCLSKASFSDEDQNQLQAMTKTKTNCQISFL